MNTFSPDEQIVMFISGFWAVAFLAIWYVSLLTLTRLGPRAPGGTLAAAPAACLAGLLLVLLKFSSHELRDDHDYVVLFMFAGVVWLALAATTSAALGIHPRYDALEGRNAPAAVAVSGALIGITLVYAGANVGEGASIWMTFLPALLATAAWVGAWAIYQRLTSVADAVAIDRDPAAAWRLAGLLVATGLILGRSVAGDYESVLHTLRDFVREGWPVAPLVLVAAGMNRWTRSKRTAPLNRHGLLPAVTYVAAAVLYVLSLGPWNHLPRGGAQ